ncbi:MAG: asparagine synthase (glutamine-hydrolyzing) [Gammaproteobacteria bacterium]|nr:asparagine synthase (glutamine-hydrolyzing) [Gammaproteobacteria bacterium]
MCGFSGFFYRDAFPAKAQSILNAMGLAIANRGPDSQDVWFDAESGIGLSHRRLAIVDLSPAGHQPMRSATGRYVIAFNGEIYNHLAIRTQLEQMSARQWRGHSDTETLLAGIEAWGLKKTLELSVGMFAMAVWDTVTGELQLARDRFGEKPLYYGWNNQVFLFGSELKSFRAHPDFKPQINRDALCLYLRHNYIPAPYSIYEGIAKLLPGTIATLKADATEVVIEHYWDAKTVMANNILHSQTDENQIETLEQLLKQAVGDQMMADVPLGAFLSGGVDSSLIVALMQQQSDKPIKTFSIGFYEKEFNEAEHAKAVASHLGTEHTELYVSSADALKLVSSMAEVYDEPFADSSQLPTYLVSQMAKQHVTVSLSGDAGDEVFCGYSRYRLTDMTWNKLSKVPVFVRKLGAKFLVAVPVKLWNQLNHILPSRFKMSNLGDKLHKAADVISSATVDELYYGLISHWKNPASVVIGGREPQTLLTSPSQSQVFKQNIPRMMALDTLTYLPDDILVKVDRAAMAVSLETRVPFLDHRVFEYAWGMPQHLKMNQGVTKDCLRKILYKYVPQQLIERPKAGFAVPIAEWLRGPLKDWAEQLIQPERLAKEGIFEPQQIATLWQEHQSGKRNWQYHLWDILMFQSWYEKNHQ